MTEKMTLYVANVPSEDIALEISQHADGFTIVHGTGYWKGEAEPTTIASVIGPANYVAIISAVTSLAYDHGEDSILIERDNEYGKFADLGSIGPDGFQSEKI